MNYFIFGTSYILVNKEKEKIIKSRNYETFYLDEINLTEILEDLRYNSMFNEEKILVIKKFDLLFQNKKDNMQILTNLLEYLKKPNKSITIIFISEQKINDKTKIGTEILSNLAKIETPIFTKPYELAKVLSEVFRKDGYAFTQNAVTLFATKCNSNYDIAINEFEKFKQIKKTKIINELDVEKIVSNYNQNEIMAFKDAVINKEYKTAFSLLNELENSKFDYFPLIVMLAKEYIEILNIKLLCERKRTNEEISSLLSNMHPYRVKILRLVSMKYTVKELKKIIYDLIKLNIKVISQDNLGYLEIKMFILSMK